MNTRKKEPRIFHPSITNCIIKFEKMGYIYDFQKVNERDFLCVQNNLKFPAESLIIDAIKLTHSKHHFLQTIETDTGAKGLLLTELD